MSQAIFEDRTVIQPWKKVYRHLGNSLINSPSIDQNIILNMLGGNMMFLLYRWFEFYIFQALYTAFYIVKDDLVLHLLNKLCWTNHSGYRFIVLLVTSKRLKLQKPDCAHLKDFLMKINLLFLKKFPAILEPKISLVETVTKKLTSSFLIFFAFSKMNVFILLLAISKRLKLQEPDCIHSEDNLTKINFFF